jgi:hypothetical protein
MTYINLKDFELIIENPIDKDILKLLLDNLQHRYLHTKLKDNHWNINKNNYRITLNRTTNCNGKYVAIVTHTTPTTPMTYNIDAMVKVYEKNRKIRVIAESYMHNMDYNFKQVILELLNYKRPNTEKIKRFNYDY